MGISGTHIREELIGVGIFVKNCLPTASNAYGFYSLTLPGGQYRWARYLGYVEKDTVLALQNNRQLAFPGARRAAVSAHHHQRECFEQYRTTSLGERYGNRDGPDQRDAGLVGVNKDILRDLGFLPGVSSSKGRCKRYQCGRRFRTRTFT